MKTVRPELHLLSQILLMAAPQVLVLVLLLQLTGSSIAAPPNIVLLFADDLGFGDLGCFGHPTSLTPNLDRISANGLKFTDFYVTSGACSPSRASLLTGRYQTRSGIYPGVFFPDSVGGLPLNETTIAEMLKPLGFSTAIMGKWHLGLGAKGCYLPTNQGFDHFVGVPYSHDQGPCENLTCFPPDIKCFGQCDIDSVLVPLMFNQTIKQQPLSFIHLEQIYSDFAVDFIRTAVQNQKPFFLYYPSHHTHYPQFAGVAGHSARGPFGDSLLEFDQTVGKILSVLEKMGVENNTLVFFTADNGPELQRMSRGGNAGVFRCGKATTYEGGMREPAIAYWPGTIRPGVTHELISSLDIFPTIARLTRATLPPVVLDGMDMSDVLLHHGKSKRESIMYYPISPSQRLGLFALRLGRYKAHFYTEGSIRSSSTPDPVCSQAASLKFHDPPLLFDLEADPSEHYPLSTEGWPDLQAVLKVIIQTKQSFEASMEFGQSQPMRGKDSSLEPCCNPDCRPRPSCCRC